MRKKRHGIGRTLGTFLLVALFSILGPWAPTLGAGVGSATRVVLDNGAEIVVIPQAGVSLATAVAIVRTGASSESPAENGISHMLEHLLFNGTASRSQEQLAADLDRRGIINNAHTGLDEMTLFMLGPREEVSTMLAAEAEMLFSSVFPADKLEKERGIVLNEIARDATRDESVVQESIDGIYFEGSPCALPVTGTEATVKALTRDAIVRYHQVHYRPENVTVILMGDVEAGPALEMARASFGSVVRPPEPQGPEPPTCRPSPRARGFLHEIRLPISGRIVSIVASVPGPSDSGHASADLLASTLEPGLAEAANARLRGTKGRILDATVSLASHKDGSTIQIEATLGPDLSYGSGVQALREAVLSRLAAPPDAEALADARVAERVSLSLLEEKPHYFGLDRAPLIACCGWQAVVDYPSQVAAVAPADVARVAASLADPTRWAIVETGGDLPESAQPVPILAETLAPAGLSPAAAGPAAPSAGAPVVSTLREVLPNGLTILVRSSDESRIFAAALIAKGRSAMEPAPQSGIADLLHRLAGNATRTRDAAHLARDLAKIGAKLKVTDDPSIPYDDADTRPEYSFIRLETLDEFAPDALALFAEMIGEPSLDGDSIERMRGLQIDRASQASASPSERARRLLVTGLLGEDSPLARSPFGTEATLRTITAPDLASFRERYFSPSNLILSIATALPGASVVDMVRKSFGSIQAGPAPRPPVPASPKTGPPSRFEEKHSAKQAYILEGSYLRPAPAEVAPLAAAAAVLSRRMSADLREKRGLAYSLGSSVDLLGGGLLFTARIGTRPEQVEAALAGLEDEIRTLSSKPPTDQEIADAVRSEGVRRLMRDLSRINRAFSAALKEMRPPDSIPAPWETLPSVTRKEVAAAVKAHLSQMTMSRVVLE